MRAQSDRSIRMPSLGGFVLLLPFALGCFALVDDDRFVVDETCDFELKLRSFGAHLGQYTEVRLVQYAEDPPDIVPADADARPKPRLLVSAIFDPLPSDAIDIDLTIPEAVLPLEDASMLRPMIDFYSDLNGDGVYSGHPADHSWRIPDACANGPDLFVHNTAFLPLYTPQAASNAASVTLCDDLFSTGPGAIDPVQATDPIEIRIYGVLPSPGGQAAERRAVAFYRLGELRARGPSGDIILPRMFDSGFEHEIQIFIDANRDGAFTEGERAWRYEYPGFMAKDCPPREALLADVCGLTLRAQPVEICRIAAGQPNGGDMRLILSRGHRANLTAPTETRWWTKVEAE